MALYDLNNAAQINYSTSAHTIDNVRIDTVGDQEFTRVSNDRAQDDWNAFMKVPKLHSAIVMKKTWSVGKGISCSIPTKVYLDHITGNGKQTFREILGSMIVAKQAMRDSFAYIVKDKDAIAPENPKGVINLIERNPKDMVIIFNDKGQIDHYEQMKPRPKGANSTEKPEFEKFELDEIFHLTHHRYAGETHGRSVPEIMESKILADDENFQVCQRLAKFQAVPFIMFKVKSDDATTIANIKANIKDARENGVDMVIPDDENILSFLPVQTTPSSFILDWRRQNNEEFYMATGMPQVLFGGGGTESNGKTSYLGHETVFEDDQRYIEEQVKLQLGFEIELNSPVSLLENMQLDEMKDHQNALTFQPNDVQAGVGK